MEYLGNQGFSRLKLKAMLLRCRLCPTNGEHDLESLRNANNLPSFVGHKRGQRKEALAFILIRHFKSFHFQFLQNRILA